MFVAKKNFEGFSASAEKVLFEYYWPGNVRELENSIERACVLGKPPLIHGEDLRISNFSLEAERSYPANKNGICNEFLFDDIVSSKEDRTLHTALTKFKTAYVKKILEETSWNQTKAGEILGIQRTYVSRLLNELHIR